jgi:hypothetical protein
MPGGGRYQWQWIGKPPIYWTILSWITVAEFAVGWVLLFTLPHWGRAAPDAAHPVEMPRRFGRIFMLPAKFAGSSKMTCGFSLDYLDL